MEGLCHAHYRATVYCRHGVALSELLLLFLFHPVHTRS